jgi:23S rRNA pseudouridine955/2504/2580 synthase
MVGGMSLKGLQKMSEIIKDRSLNKYYLAIVKGKIEKKECLNGFLYKDEKTNQVKVYSKPFRDAVEIHTEYEPLAVKDDLCIVLVKLITGKTHQIRAHLAYIGHPILGDTKYGNAKLNDKYKVRQQLLHSYKVVFPKMDEDFSHLSEKSFVTEYPKAFNKLFIYEEIEAKLTKGE